MFIKVCPSTESSSSVFVWLLGVDAGAGPVAGCTEGAGGEQYASWLNCMVQGFLLQESSCRLWSRKAWVEAGGGAGAGGGGAASRQFHYRRLPPVCQRLATMYQLPPAPPSALLAQLLHRQPRERLREFSLQETKAGSCQNWDEQHSAQSLKDLPKYGKVFSM